MCCSCQPIQDLSELDSRSSDESVNWLKSTNYIELIFTNFIEQNTNLFICTKLRQYQYLSRSETLDTSDRPFALVGIGRP